MIKRLSIHVKIINDKIKKRQAFSQKGSALYNFILINK
jgi:hypothetical protein